MSYPSYFVEVLRELHTASGWTKVFLFYQRFGVSPMQIAELIDTLGQQNLLQHDAQAAAIRLTPDGYKWVDRNVISLFMTPRAAKQWRAGPVSKNKDEPYIPHPSGLEREFLTLLGKQ